MVLPRTMVLMIDVVILTTSVFVIHILWNSYANITIPISELMLVLPILLLVNVVAFIYFKTFSGILRFSSFGDLAKVVYALTVGYGITFVFVTIFSRGGGRFELHWEALFLIYILNVVLMVLSRIVVKEVYELITSESTGYQNVFVYGTKLPAKMDEIMEIAGRYDIPVLEDAAEALGSTYKGQKCGTFGEFACLSFNGNKMITTSGGGALVCRTEEEKKRTMFFATQARDNAPHYQHSHIGYNYRLSNICAGIGRGQMLVLDEFIARRREINALYRELLKDVEGVSFLKNPSDDFDSNHWLTCVLIDEAVAGFSREDLRLALEVAKIESRPLWKPMHLQPVFADAPYYGDGVSERLFDDGLCLPSGAGLSDDEIERVVQVVRQLTRYR